MAGIAAKASIEVRRSLPSTARRVAVPLARRGKISLLIQIFIFSLAVPVVFQIGPLRLSPNRLVLIATFIPCLVAWLSGSTGRIRLPDIFMLLTAIWAAVALMSLHGFDGGPESAGIFAIETFGTFLFARRYIRDVFTFKYMVKCLVLMVLLLLPFAAYENLTGSPVLIKLFEKIFSVFPHWPSESRSGLSRAAVTFEHPILFGVVCSSAFALSFYTATRLAGRLASSLVVVTTFTSLSSGPLLSLVIQAMLIVWDTVTKSLPRRWIILAILAIVTYFVIDILSNRPPIVVITSYLTFSADNAYIRVLIWRYGTQSVMQHPIFGTGLNEWERPEWLGDSLDNFWLANAVRYGIPGFFFLTSGFISVCFGLGQIRNLPFQVAQYRKGLIITLCGLAAVGGTVHFWNATYVMFIFLLGSGMWIFEHRNRAAATSNTLNNPSVMRNPTQGGQDSDGRRTAIR